MGLIVRRRLRLVSGRGLVSVAAAFGMPSELHHGWMRSPRGRLRDHRSRWGDHEVVIGLIEVVMISNMIIW